METKINETANYFDIDFNGDQIRVLKDGSQIQILNDHGDGDYDEAYVNVDNEVLKALRDILNTILA